MLRKPGKDEPLPAFGSDEDDLASTGEYRAVIQDGKSPFDRSRLPRFDASDELPSFASLENNAKSSGLSGKGALPRFPSMPDAHEVSPPRSAPPSRPLPAPAKAPARAPEPLPRYPSIPDADVAATLEKQPVSAQAANRILAQLDRKPVRADSTSEVMLEDVLEEVYAEPSSPRSSSSNPEKSRAPVSSRAVSSRPSEPAPASPPSAAPSAPSAPSAPRSSSSNRPPPSPVATARALLEQAATEIAFPPVEVPRSAPPPPMPAAMPPAMTAPPLPAHAAPVNFAPAPAAAVPPGYMLVPQPALGGPVGQAPAAGYLAPVGMGMAAGAGPSSAPYAPGSSPLAYATASESYTRPLPSDVAGPEPRSGGLLSKIVAGGLILGLSALAGGAASVWLVPQKDSGGGAPPPPSANAIVPSAMPPANSSAPAPTISSTVAPPSAGLVDASAGTPAQMVPASQGWPLAPATVPPGAGSLAPPPPSGSAVPTATGEKAPSTPSATPQASAAPALSETSGRLTFPAARQGHRVWVDGAVMGTSPTPIVVKCGKHTVRLGSSGSDRTVDVPCGGDFLVR